jgi:DNA-binding PadR family transcriptional regulator
LRFIRGSLTCATRGAPGAFGTRSGEFEIEYYEVGVMSGRRRQQPLSQTEFEVLLALADEDRHGYGIMQEVSRRSKGAVHLGPGALYGAMKRLLDAGFVEESRKRPKQDDARRRCYYHLTRAGRAIAREQAETLAMLLCEASHKRLLSVRVLPAS